PLAADPAPLPAPAPGPAPAAAPVAAPAPAPAPAAAAGTPVPSPLSGKVVSLDVPAGTAVKNGDKIMTLEAMKMNTDIYAEADGTVTFAVAPGDTVAEGQPLAYLG
ncbi:MAG: acetyl-CoA carboxylase biotin carboxyl carrier protein subunit, partial [Akkermansia sp.]|nr:acetyl-CoA carboxylase biotin carboxyl carrier protein subunit [Akkermansia sp.]